MPFRDEKKVGKISNYFLTSYGIMVEISSKKRVLRAISTDEEQLKLFILPHFLSHTMRIAFSQLLTDKIKCKKANENRKEFLFEKRSQVEVCWWHCHHHKNKNPSHYKS